MLVNTEKGRKIFNGLDCIRMEMSYEDVLRRNRCLEQSVAEPAGRADFFASTDSIHDTIRRLI